jgi:hypothetical protein
LEFLHMNYVVQSHLRHLRGINTSC